MKKTWIARKGKSENAKTKNRLQALVREIVMKRDGGCILRDKRHCGAVLGLTGHVFQADHLVTRSNSATFTDTRLIVCLCKACHGGWKQWNKEAYDALVKTVISKERVALWERAEEARSSHKTTKMDWIMEEIALQQELKQYE